MITPYDFNFLFTILLKIEFGGNFELRGKIWKTGTTLRPKQSCRIIKKYIEILRLEEKGKAVARERPIRLLDLQTFHGIYS